jgi:hypothetical protein
MQAGSGCELCAVNIPTDTGLIKHSVLFVTVATIIYVCEVSLKVKHIYEAEF